MLLRHLSDARQWSFPFLAKLSLARFIQLQVGSNGFTTQFDGPAARYFDNVTAGVKLHLADQRSVLPSLSLSGAIGVPVLEHQQGYAPADDAFVIAYVTKDFGPLHADLALSMNLPPPFGVMVEEYYFTDAAPFAARDGGCLFALSVTPRPWLVFDFGGDAGYFSATRTYSSFVGMTIVPVKLWP